MAVFAGIKVAVGVFVTIGDGVIVKVAEGDGVGVVGITKVIVGVKVKVVVGVNVAVGDSTGRVRVTVIVPSGVPVERVEVGVICVPRRFELQINPRPIQ